MSCYTQAELYIDEVGAFRKVALVDEFLGRPVYLDLETGEMYCPWTNNIEIAPPLEGTPEAGLWSRLRRYIETVLARTR